MNRTLSEVRPYSRIWKKIPTRKFLFKDFEIEFYTWPESAATKSETMDSLARRVASPKGTTEAGLAVLDHEGALRRLVEETVDAARRRGAELAAEARGEQLA